MKPENSTRHQPSDLVVNKDRPELVKSNLKHLLRIVETIYIHWKSSLK